MPPRRAHSGSSGSGGESSINDEIASQAAKLEEERRVGLPPRAPFPKLSSRPDPPFVREAAIFVSNDLMFSDSSECAGDLLLNEDSVRISRAYGLAMFCRMISSGISGSAVSVNYSEGTIQPSFDFNDSAAGAFGRMRPKVEVEIIAMLADYSKAMTEPGNVVGFIIRAIAVDPEYSFSTALAHVLHQNMMLKTKRPPSSGLVYTLKKLQKDCGTFVNQKMSHRDLFSAIANYQHYHQAVCDWAANIREVEAKNDAEEMIISAEKTLLNKKKKAQQAAEKRKRNPSKKKKKSDGDSDSDIEEVDDENDPDLMPETLEEDKKKSIMKRALRAVKNNEKLAINKVMSQLGFELDHKDQCRLSHDSLLELTMDADSRANKAGDVARDTSTPKSVVEGLQYQVASYTEWVTCAMIPFTGTEDNQPEIREAYERARVLDGDVRVSVDLDKTPLCVEKTFTLQAALERAHRAGAEEERCNVHGYYTVPKDLAGVDKEEYADARAEMEWGSYPATYDPSLEFDCNTFAPAQLQPVWVRACIEAPWASQQLSPDTTWRLSMSDMQWSRFLNLRFPWAEDDTPDRIKAAYNKAIEVSGLNKNLVKKLVCDVKAVRVEDDAIEVATHEGMRIVSIRPGSSDPENTSASDDDGGEGKNSAGGDDDDGNDNDYDVRIDSFMQDADDDDQLVSIARDLSAAQFSVPVARALVNSEQRKKFAADTARVEDELRKSSSNAMPQVPKSSTMDAHTHYVSNFTMLANDGRVMDRQMRELAILDPDKHAELMPDYRRMCMRRFSRVYLSGAYNNGPVMRAIRAYDQKNWTVGAYLAVSNIETGLTRFGNRQAGDIITLQAVYGLNMGHALLWRMLTALRISAFDNNTAKLHQLMLTKTSIGKSHLFGVFRKLSLPASIVEAIHTSAQAGIDALATDDVIKYGDEAPDTLTRSGRADDPASALAANVMRTAASEGTVSANRSHMGLVSKHFVADSHVTYVFNSNFVMVPKAYERSMLMRFAILRLLHDSVNSTMVYQMHKPRAGSVEVRTTDVETLWHSTQCLGGIMAKAMMDYALPEPDTNIVPLLLEHVLRRVDGWMPLWAESMRASQRLRTLCRSYAMFSAIDAVFNSPLSPLSPERVVGRKTPFDPMQMLMCAPYMFTTTEMFVSALFSTLEEAIPTDSHIYMYALASNGNWTNSAMDHLFVHGGRDHEFTLHQGAGADHSVRNTSRGFVMANGVEVTDPMITAWTRAKEYVHMRDTNAPEWHEMARETIRTHTGLRDGCVYDFNAKNQIITDKMLKDALDRDDLLRWYDELCDEHRQALEIAATMGKSALSKWKITGWLPKHFDRADATQMPAFWRAANHLYRYIDGSVSSDSRERSINFRTMSNGEFDPNFIDIRAKTAELAPRLAQLLGSSVSRQNVDYAISHYLMDRAVTTITVPRLRPQTSKRAGNMCWMTDDDGNIVTHNINFVSIDKSEGLISVSTVWLYAGCPHNHLMTMLASLEDDHLPEEGLTILLPLPFPESPWVMQHHVMRRRPGHVLTRPNPFCSNETVIRVSTRTIASHGATQALDATLDPDSEVPLSASTIVDSAVYRTARELTTAASHSIDREAAMETSTTQVSVPECFAKFDKQRNLRRGFDEMQAASDFQDTDVAKSMNDPRVIEMLARAKNSSRSDFFSPARSTVSFVDNSFEDELYEAFIRRSGINPLDAITCRPSMRDKLASKDFHFVTRLVERTAERAGLQLVACHRRLLEVMKSADPLQPSPSSSSFSSSSSSSPSASGPFDVMISTTPDTAGHSGGAIDETSHALKKYSEARQNAIALGNHYSSMASDIPYPGKHVRATPQWMLIEEADVIRRRQQKEADARYRRIRQIPIIPSPPYVIIEESSKKNNKKNDGDGEQRAKDAYDGDGNNSKNYHELLQIQNRPLALGDSPSLVPSSRARPAKGWHRN